MIAFDEPDLDCAVHPGQLCEVAEEKMIWYATALEHARAHGRHLPDKLVVARLRGVLINAIIGGSIVWNVADNYIRYGMPRATVVFLGSLGLWWLIGIARYAFSERVRRRQDTWMHRRVDK